MINAFKAAEASQASRLSAWSAICEELDKAIRGATSTGKNNASIVLTPNSRAKPESIIDYLVSNGYKATSTKGNSGTAIDISWGDL